MRNSVIIQKLYQYSLKLIDYCNGYTYDSFSADIKLVEACVFNLSQMGELCHIADREFTKEHPEIAWAEMYGLRNRIVHDYEGVNLLLVWEIISKDIPLLRDRLQKLVQREETVEPDEWDLEMIAEAEKENDGTAISIEDLAAELGIT